LDPRQFDPDASDDLYVCLIRERSAGVYGPAFDCNEYAAYYGSVTADGEYGFGYSAPATTYGTFFDNGASATAAYDIHFVDGSSGDDAYGTNYVADGSYASGVADGYATIVFGYVGSPTACTGTRSGRHLRGPPRLGHRVRDRELPRVRSGHHPAHAPEGRSALTPEGTTGVRGYENRDSASSSYVGSAH
jgi:hypothetical protein